MNRQSLEAIAAAVVFVGFIAAHFLLGSSAAVKVLGIGCVVSGVVWAVEKSVPVGIEGRKPSFFVRGAGALAAALAIAFIGGLLLFYSAPAACMLGWAAGAACG